MMNKNTRVLTLPNREKFEEFKMVYGDKFTTEYISGKDFYLDENGNKNRKYPGNFIGRIESLSHEVEVIVVETDRLTIATLSLFGIACDYMVDENGQTIDFEIRSKRIMVPETEMDFADVIVVDHTCWKYYYHYLYRFIDMTDYGISVLSSQFYRDVEPVSFSYLERENEKYPRNLVNAVNSLRGQLKRLYVISDLSALRAMEAANIPFTYVMPTKDFLPTCFDYEFSMIKDKSIMSDYISRLSNYVSMAKVYINALDFKCDMSQRHSTIYINDNLDLLKPYIGIDKDAQVFAAFPASGKTYATEILSKGNRVLDSDSSNFSWIVKEDGTRERNPEFPKNYIQHIKESIPNYDYIFISTHKAVLQAMEEENLDFVVVYPGNNCLNEWVGRCYTRKNNGFPIEVLIDNWNTWLDDMAYFAKRHPHYCMNKNQYLLEVVTRPDSEYEDDDNDETGNGPA